ncbi:MAG: hypothetical protein RLY58_1565 [Pseudomonadota bacterium]|jgi:DNA-binding beta-propeller fold protein YncE
MADIRSAVFGLSVVLTTLTTSITHAAILDVVAVGNAAGGTVTFLDGNTFTNLGSLNVTPDLAQRKLAIFANPVYLIGYNTVKNQKGGERFVDDVATSLDGSVVYISRGMLRDVAAFSLQSKKMLWRTELPTFNSDHMALSPDGRKLVVSATTAKKAYVINPQTGEITGNFETGDYPHENRFSADGRRIYNDSIGITSLSKSLESLKGKRQITVVDADTLQQIRVYPFAEGVRPSILTADEKFDYHQRSYNRGFVEVDLTTGNITREAKLPTTPEGDAIKPDDYPSNSAHHGLAMSGDGTKFCNAGTIDNYTAIVRRSDFSVSGVVYNQKLPYWSTTSKNGAYCLVSNSKGNYISVISYDTAKEVKQIPVGNYPQRERLAKLDTRFLSNLIP